MATASILHFLREFQGRPIDEWYACESCRLRVAPLDNFCRHCGVKLTKVRDLEKVK